MATTVERTIPATVEQVFALLSDAPAYGRFVVGAKHVRAADDAWPAVGSQLHHTSGVGPLQVQDRTVVERCEPPHLLVLRAGLRPFGEAVVRFELRDEGGRTVVAVEERFETGVLRSMPSFLADPLVAARNRAMLSRVEDEVLERVRRG
jgi:uncharacterized protein YndB with AHSA1/START domain